jgi:hypothetical protein
MKQLITFLSVMLSVAAVTHAQTITRGPYLQSPGQTSIIVRWRTDVASDSRVYYGLDFTTAMTQFVEDAQPTTEHRIKIEGLNPNTTYYYTIATSSAPLEGPEEPMHFTTAPDTTGAGTPVRFWTIGDFGHGNEGQQMVRDSYQRFADANEPADLWLWLGDNVYQDGTDEEYSTKVFDTVYGYHDIMKNLPFMPTSGNHDYNSICPWEPVTCFQDPNGHDGPYLQLIDIPTEGELGGVPSNIKLYYSYDYGDIHFVSLNSEIGSVLPNYDWLGLTNSDPDYSSPMLDWLRADLAATTKKWKVVYWHQCPYSGQNNFTDDSIQRYCIATREHFNPIVEQYGVDLVLSGHDHNYQRTFLINGHYGYKNSFTPEMMINGTSGKEALGEEYIKYTDGPMKDVGTVYVVEGNASNGNDQSPIEHPAIYWGHACSTCIGSVIVDVDGDRLDLRYITATDSVLDNFTILKTNWTGINENETPTAVGISPNPTTSQINVSYTLWSESPVHIALVDISGRTVHTIRIASQGAGNYHHPVDLKHIGLATGMYSIQLQCADGISTKRLLLSE